MCVQMSKDITVEEEPLNRCLHRMSIQEFGIQYLIAVFIFMDSSPYFGCVVVHLLAQMEQATND